MRALGLVRVLAVSIFLLLPCAAWAQSSISGVVRDASGGVLPGVTVEAASPVLIEGVRSAVTDAQGIYKVVDLRPGTYTVTFSLPGFTIVEARRSQPAGRIRGDVNADLAVGALEETVTVSGEAPVVDVKSSTRADAVREVDDRGTSGRRPAHGAVGHRPRCNADPGVQPRRRRHQRSHADTLQRPRRTRRRSRTSTG